MATFYKGAGIGTHWHTHDSQEVGFEARSPTTVPTIEEMITHVARETANSPYVSVTCSYAVAWHYAVYSGREIPSLSHPAYVYEIEIDMPPSGELYVCDPVAEVSQMLLGSTGAGIQGEVPTYQHNGLPSLLLGVVDPEKRGHCLVGRQPQPPGPGALSPPNITRPLRTFVNVLRDAEILVYRHIPAVCVTDRFDVVESGWNQD